MWTFWARIDSNSANNPALNLTGDPAVQFTFVESGPNGDLALDANGGAPDPDTQVDIGGTLYDFTFELSGELPTQNRDGAGQVPDQFEGAQTFVVSVQDYPSPGETTRLTFLPDENATQADMDAFGNGRISLQNLETEPTPDYIVEGTSGDDVIDANYGGDLEGDRIDNDDGNPLQPGPAGGDNDSVTAGMGNDYVASGAGDDTVLGEDGADTIAGGSGDDDLSGGADADTFLLEDGFGNDTISGGETVTTGTDQDVIDLSNVTNGVTVTYSGSEAGSIVEGADTVSFSEIEQFVLTDQGDSLDAATDTSGVNVDAGAGADSLVGGSGDDTLLGGDGNDTLIAGNNTGVGDFLSGGAGDDVLTDSFGNATLEGGADADLINLGFGNATVNGGSLGFDQDTISFALADDAVDILFSGDEAGSYADTDGDSGSFVDIEALELTSGDDSVDASATTAGVTIDAGAGNDSITGGAGSDSIQTGAGDDVVYTGAGADTVETGEGSDTIYLDDADGGQSNVLTDSGTTGTDSIILATGAGTYRIQGDFSSATGFETIDGSGASGDTLGTQDGVANFDFTGITLTGVDEIQGTDNADTIIGSASADSIDGGSGNDSLSGGAGNDTILGGIGNDTLLGDANNDLIFGAVGADDIEGGDGADTLFGGDGNDILSGNDGTDTIFGEDGDDILFGGQGDDSVRGGIGADTVYGGQGADSILGGDGNDYLFGDDFSATGGDDTIEGGAGDDTLSGNAGDDVLTGGADNDFFMVSDGNDTVTDFNFGNTGALGDGDIFNNDFIDLSGYYDNLDEVRADQADDGILNQSNAFDDEGNAVDYSDNTQFGTNSLAIQGASSSSYTADNTGIVCFTAGTRILTPRGPVSIENLEVGDLVVTKDHGAQPLAWIGRRHVGPDQLETDISLRPILIRKGTLGNERDLLVSRQHGMLIGGDNLVRAVHLAEKAQGCRIAHGKKDVTYIHLMFDAHQIVFAEGVPSESFFPGPMALKMMSPEDRSGLRQRFPQLTDIETVEDAEARYGPLARPFAKKKHVKALLNATNPHTQTARHLIPADGMCRAA